MNQLQLNLIFIQYAQLYPTKCWEALDIEIRISEIYERSTLLSDASDALKHNLEVDWETEVDSD